MTTSSSAVASTAAQPYSETSSGATSIRATTLPPYWFLMSIIRVSSGSLGSMRSSPSSTANGSCATCCSAHSTAWPSPLGAPWRT